MNSAQCWNTLEREYWSALEKQAPDEKYRRQYKAHKLGCEFKGLSDSQKRDLEFYLSGEDAKRYQTIHWIPQRTFVYYHPKSIEEWYWLWDTHGLETEFRDWKLGEAIKQEKEWTNLTIKNWVEDIMNFLLRPHEVAECCKEFPTWVWKAFKNQLNKCAIYEWQRVK